MIFGILSFIVIAAAIAGACFVVYKQFDDMETISRWDAESTVGIKERNKKRRVTAIIAIVMAVVFLILLIIVPFSFHTVDQSEVAVVKSLGKIKTTQTAGTYFDLWIMNNYTKYSTKVQEVDLEDMAYSSDAQQMTLNIKFQYQIMPDKVKEIATNYGSLNTLEARITPTVRDKVKSVLSSLTAMEIIEKRESLSGIASEAVKDALGSSYYVNVTSVAITNIDFSDQFESAVEEKMIAEQKALKAEYENAAKVAKAQADADAKLIKAEADAKANELLEDSITDKILEKQYLDKWDGKLPQVVTGDNTGIMIPSLGD